jgi:FeS assembly SUF system protein
MSDDFDPNRADDSGSPQHAEGPEAGDGEPARTPEQIKSDVIDLLRTVYDPEVPVNIFDMGLIYDVDVEEDRSVYVKMTLTTPMCPVAETLPPEVEAKARGVAGVTDVHLDLVWDPPWHPGMMSEAARLELNMM